MLADFLTDESAQTFCSQTLLIYKFQQNFYQLLTTQRLIESDFLQLFRIDSWYEKQERTLTSALPSNTMEDQYQMKVHYRAETWFLRLSKSYSVLNQIQLLWVLFYWLSLNTILFGAFSMIFGLYTIIFGAFLIIFSLYTILFGAFLIIFGLYTILFGAFSIIFGAFSIIFGSNAILFGAFYIIFF